MDSMATDATFPAIYEQGALRLLSPLSLPEDTRVTVVVREIDATDEMRRTEKVLVATGLVTPPSAAQNATPVSEARLAETAALYSAGGPLSEQIIAERDER